MSVLRPITRNCYMIVVKNIGGACHCLKRALAVISSTVLGSILFAKVKEKEVTVVLCRRK